MPTAGPTSRGWLQRWRKAPPARRDDSEESQPATPAPAPQTAAEPPLSPIGEAAAPGARAVVLVTVLGLSRDALEEVVELVVKESQARPITPVFITDSLEFDPFRRRRLAFEYLPDRATRARFAPDLDWDLYERRRYGLLRDKWRPSSLVSFGRSPPKECAALVRSGS